MPEAEARAWEVGRIVKDSKFGQQVARRGSVVVGQAAITTTLAPGARSVVKRRSTSVDAPGSPGSVERWTIRWVVAGAAVHSPAIMLRISGPVGHDAGIRWVGRDGGDTHVGDGDRVAMTRDGLDRVRHAAFRPHDHVNLRG